jgi:hypothetical protein
MDPDARARLSFTRTWPVEVLAQPSRSLQIVMLEVVRLPAAALTLRIGVASRALKRAGTVQIGIDLSRSSDSIARVRGALLAGGPAPDVVLGHETVRSLFGLQPTLDRTFAADGMLQVLVPIVWKAVEDQAVTTVTLRQADGKVVRQSQLPVVAHSHENGQREGHLRTEVSLSGLQPGDYLLEIAVQLTGGPSDTHRIPLRLR